MFYIMNQIIKYLLIFEKNDSKFIDSKIFSKI